MRLYSLGPWNSGWSLAALLLGGGAALWAALAAFTRPAERRGLTQMSVLAMALAGFALGSGAGIVAGCYALLAYLVLALPHDRRPTTDHRRPQDRLTLEDRIDRSAADHGPRTQGPRIEVAGCSNELTTDNR